MARASHNPDPRDWQRAVRMGWQLNNWIDGDLLSPEDSPSLDNFSDEDRAEVDDLAQVIDILTASSVAIRRLIEQGTLKPSLDRGYQAELGPYGIVELIGQGAMGLVLRAVDQRLEREVAIKIMRAGLVGDRNARMRFMREARAVARLRHANIVAIHEVGESNGIPFLVMEYVDGYSLADRIQAEHPFPGETVAEVFEQIIVGLDQAHRAGIIHRDIKSSNILWDPGTRGIKIADFGLAVLTDNETRITLGETALGTPVYMSPEQANGSPNIDARTDLYSAGVVLFELLTGHLPFEGKHPAVLIRKILEERPALTDRALEPACAQMYKLSLRLLAKHPEDRLPSAQAVLNALHQCGPIDLPERRRMIVKRSVAAVALLVLLVLIVVPWINAKTPAGLVPKTPSLSDARAATEFGGPSRRIVVQWDDDAAWQTFADFEGESVQVLDAVAVNHEEQRVVVAGLADPARDVGISVLNANGRELWTISATDHRRWPDVNQRDTWVCASVIALDVDLVPGEEVVVMCHGDGYPTRISILDLATREFQSTFWHMGHIAKLIVLRDFFPDGRPALAAHGFNNKLDGFDDQIPQTSTYSPWDLTPVAMILDPMDMDGLGPPTTNRVPGLTSSTPIAYRFLNRPYTRTVCRVTGDTDKRARVLQRVDAVFTDDEFANIGDIEVAHAPADAPLARLVVYLQGIDAVNNPRTRGALLVDRNLEPLAFHPTNTGGETRELTLADWRPYWRKIERN